MAEFKINGTSYPLKMGMKFIKEVDDRVVRTENGITQKMGVSLMIAGVYDGDVEALEDAILTANKTESPRINPDELEKYIEADSTDIDDLFKVVLGFFENSNCTKMKYKGVMEGIEQVQAAQ